MRQRSVGSRILPLVLTSLVALWGILGSLDLQRQALAGFETNAYNTVTQVDPGSPAEAAGLQPGDQITHFDGIPVQDAGAIARLPRKSAGDTQRITILADGESQDLSIVYAPIPQRRLAKKHAALAVGLCFLLFPVTALYRKPGEATRVLTIMGVGLSLAFLTGPNIPNFTLHAVTVAITSLFVMFGVAALLHFLLAFPQRRPWLERSHAKKALYLPAFLLWLLFAWRLLFTPSATEAVNLVTNTLAAVIIGAYLLLSLFQVLRNYSRTNQIQRKALGLNMALLGTVVGIVPATVAQLVYAFSPQAGLPGQDFYFVTLAFIPLTWARSASR